MNDFQGSGRPGRAVHHGNQRVALQPPAEVKEHTSIVSRRIVARHFGESRLRGALLRGRLLDGLGSWKQQIRIVGVEHLDPEVEDWMAALFSNDMPRSLDVGGT